MRVEVTADDIENGVPRSPSSCPIALALDRATSACWRVDGACAENNDGGRIALTYACWRFARRFDRGEDVEPFAFETGDV